MTTGFFFHLRDWAAWAPSQEWVSAASGDIGSSSMTRSAMPALLRRRISPLGQAALRCAWHLPQASAARIVCASRHGEFGRTLSILQSVIAGELASPADFTLSVHHALAGLLSIAQGNRRGHTAVSAGPESFGFGFLEALGCLAECPEEPVLFIYYDEALPAPFDAFDGADFSPLAVAFHLTASGPGDRFSLSMQPNGLRSEPSARPDLGFLRFLLVEDGGAAFQGERMTWQWRRHAEAA